MSSAAGMARPKSSLDLYRSGVRIAVDKSQLSLVHDHEF